MEALLASDPATVGEFQLKGRLGGGGMGQVYLGVMQSGRPVAVKLIREEVAADPSFRQRFAREVAAARQVGGFWTASVVAADAEAPRPWLATEYVAGPSLAQAVAENGPLPLDTARAVAARVAEALAAIHQAGLVHRDLKPGNVLLGANGPVVIDFGIARVFHTETAALTSAIGTPTYMAPELFRGEPLQPTADMYALGATLVYAVQGRGPFPVDTPAATAHQIISGEPDLTGVPDELRPLITACLDKDPARRPTPAQLLVEIGPAAGAVLTPYGEWGAPAAAPPGGMPGYPPAAAPPPWHPAPGFGPAPAPGGPALGPVPGPGYAPGPPGGPYWRPPAPPGPAYPAAQRPATVIIATTALSLASIALLVASAIVPYWYQRASRAIEGSSLSADDQRGEIMTAVGFNFWGLALTVPSAVFLLAVGVAAFRGRPGARTLTLSLGSVFTTLLALLTALSIFHVVYAFGEGQEASSFASDTTVARAMMYEETAWLVAANATGMVAAVLMALVAVVFLAFPPSGRYFRHR